MVKATINASTTDIQRWSALISAPILPFAPADVKLAIRTAAGVQGAFPLGPNPYEVSLTNAESRRFSPCRNSICIALQASSLPRAFSS